VRGHIKQYIKLLICVFLHPVCLYLSADETSSGGGGGGADVDKSYIDFVVTLLLAYFWTNIIGAFLVHFLLKTVLIHVQYKYWNLP
jgi:hypothetical protein